MHLFLKIVLLCFVPFISLAQNTFFKEYNYLDFNSQKSVKVYSANQFGDKYIVGGEKYNGSFVNTTSFIAILDLEGNVLSFTEDNVYFSTFLTKNCIVGNNIFFAGKKFDSFGTDHNVMKIIAKYSMDGELIWNKTFGDTTKYLNDNRVVKFFSRESGFVVFASTNGGNGDTDAEISFLNANGELMSRKLFAWNQNEHYTDYYRDAAVQSDGYVGLIESLEPVTLLPKYLLIKTDFNGNELWRKDISNYDFQDQNIAGLDNNACSIIPFIDNSTVVIFATETINGISSQIILAQFDENGNLLDSKTSLNDSNNYEVDYIYSNERNEIFLSGSKAGDSTIFYDVFAAKFSENFELIWNKNWGYDDNELSKGFGAVLTNDGGIIVGGSKLRYEYPPGFNFFLVKTDCMGNLEWGSESCVIPSDEDIVVMGNPITNELLIQFPQLNADEVVDFELINSIGQIVRKRTILGPIMNENVESLASGIYFYTATTSGGISYSGKVLKQ